jgi:Flp pilus assembly protein TadG
MMLSRSKTGRGPIPLMMTAIWRRRLHDEEGQSIVETAMSLMILLTFMFGVFEAGFALYSFHFISEAAREGTRYAIVRGSSAGPACSAPGPPICSAQGGNNTGDIATYVKDLGFPGINPNNMTVNSTWSAYVHGSSCPSTGPCNSPGNLVKIVVTYNFPLTVPFVPLQTYSMSSTSAMIIQN